MKRIAFQWLVLSSVLASMAFVAQARTRPLYGGVLRIETSGALWSPDGPASNLTTETLTRVDEFGHVHPWLATKWESQNRGQRWLFTIRPGVQFHDGTSLTADLVAQMLSTCTNCSWRTLQIAGNTLVFEFDAPEPLFAAELASRRFAIAKPGTNYTPIGTGPMQVDQTNANSAKLVAFEDYWNGRGFIGSVEITADRPIREQSLDLGVGRTDLAEVPAEQIKRAQQDRRRVLASRNDELIVLLMNTASASVRNPDVRQAMAETVDRTSLLNVIFQRQGELTGTLLPNWMTGYGPLFPTAQNITHARELRSRAGGIPALTLTYDAADPSMQLVGERIALSARDAGITIRTTPAPAHWDLTLYRVRLDSYEPSIALEDLVGTLGLERKTPDDSAVESLYRRERELLDTGYVVPLLYLPHAYAASDHVHDWKLDGRGSPAYLDLWTEVPR